MLLEKYSLNPFNLTFNPRPSTLMHIDINSCFATIEQQANPYFRGKPLVVAANNVPSGCVLAASTEAKKLGIKTGMLVKFARSLCHNLIIKEPDPWKYRNVHLKLKELLKDYTNEVMPKSIDEFVLDFNGYPAFNCGLFTVALDIKERIKKEIGEWITVSIGIGPSRFIAKTAAGLKKPDGLEEINHTNYQEQYSRLSLDDLCGIANRNTLRLNHVDIYTVMQMYHASLPKLRAAFKSINSYYWLLRLRGWEIDDAPLARKSYGNSFVLPKALPHFKQYAPVLTKLTQKMAHRLRKGGYYARGVHLFLMFQDHTAWHQGMLTKKTLFDSCDIYRYILRLHLNRTPKKLVKKIAVTVFDLVEAGNLQLELFSNLQRQEKLVSAMDDINSRWGDFVLTPARMMHTGHAAPDRIAFGGVKELEEFSHNLPI